VSGTQNLTIINPEKSIQVRPTIVGINLCTDRTRETASNTGVGSGGVCRGSDTPTIYVGNIDMYILPRKT